MARMLHDPETYLKMKTDKSAQYFKYNRVQTCGYIKKVGGKSVAMAFPLEKTGWKAPNSYQNTKRSSEVDSWSRKTFQKQPYHHLGMSKKPLGPYNPNAKRSTLPIASIVMPYKNSSQVVIGDRASYKPKHF